MTTVHRPRLAIHTCVLLLLGGSVVAQNPQFANVGEVIPDGFGHVIAAADYEGDGDVDLFATGGLFLNEGGHFVPGPVWPAAFDPGINVRSAEVADFNGDGLVDLMITRLGGSPSGLVLLLAPSGGGSTFGITAALPTAIAQPWEMTVADVDGDADMDVIVGNTHLPSNWQLHLNNGAGTFTAAPVAQWPSSAGTANIHWLASGDFDGDGWVDVVGSDLTGTYWRRNLGGGSFGATQVMPATLSVDNGVVGDFNGDGFDDFFAVESAGFEVLYLGSPSGPVPGTPTFGGYLGGQPVAVDRDGDGKDELLRSVTQVSGALDGELFLRPGQTSGLGAAVSMGPIRYGFNSVGLYPGIAVFDVDLDGDQDTVIAPGGMAPYVLLQTVIGTHQLAQKAVPAALESVFAPPRDVDGDGNVDLLRATLANGLVTLEAYLNDGRGCFAGAPVWAGSYSAVAAGEPTWADLDGDGDPDLWTESPFTNSSNLALLNNGAGVFSVGASVPFLGRSTATVIADFNGDQIPDVVVARPMLIPFPPIFQAPMFVPGLQVPTGVGYGVPAQLGPPELIVDMVAMDAEFDGDLDLLVATVGQLGAPGPVYFYQNDGNANFTAQPPLAGASATTLAVGDINGDGLDDLVLGGEAWLRSGQTFAAHSFHPVPLRHISLADLDEDGDLDLFDEAGRWYPGDGAGNFAAPIDFVPYMPVASGLSRGGRAPVDFDNDGDLDTIGPHASGDGHFAIYSNLKRHAAPTTLATPGNPIGLSVYGDVGSPWFLGVSLPTTSVIGLPFGPLFLDPANLFVVSGGVIPANGRADTSAVIPVNGAGFTLTWQALVGQSLRFTNAFDTPIAF